MKLFNWFLHNKNTDSYSEKDEWDRLEKETVNKMKNDAQEIVDKLTPEEYIIYKRMKIIAGIFLPLSFIACWWNLVMGSLICLVLSTIWFFIWFRKNIRYALIFYFTFVLSSSYFFITYLFDLIFHRV